MDKEKLYADIIKLRNEALINFNESEYMQGKVWAYNEVLRLLADEIYPELPL